MAEKKETVEFSAKVPTDLYEEFKTFVPPYGGTQWFINAALAGFIEKMRENPSLVAHVESSVESMLRLNRIAKESSV